MKKHSIFKTGIIIVIACLLVIAGSIFLVRKTYHNALQPVSDSQEITLVTVPSGASVKDIANILAEEDLIREPWAFEWHVRNTNLRDELKAGTYALRPSQGVEEIAEIIAHGEVATELVTILPGQRLDQIEASFINSGFEPEDVSDALEAEHYRDHPAVVDKPDGAGLDGYLYPESFQIDGETTPHDIVRQSLDEMQKRLTPSIRSAIANQGLSVHEGVILASIVEMEVSDVDDKAKVAQVFLNRLDEGMKLEADPTAVYGAIVEGETSSIPEALRIETAYNTYFIEALPPGPISNVSQSSLEAVANPTSSDYLYFVSGDDGTTHFSETFEGHQENIERYCTELCN